MNCSAGLALLGHPKPPFVLGSRFPQMICMVLDLTGAGQASEGEDEEGSGPRLQMESGFETGLEHSQEKQVRSANVLKIIAQNDKRLIIPQEDTLGKIGPGPGHLKIGQCCIQGLGL